MSDTAHVNDPPRTVFEVTLIGGPCDGDRVRMEMLRPLQVPTTGETVTYRPEWYGAEWPVPGWTFDPLEMFEFGGRANKTGNGIRPTWWNRVWATDERHSEIAAFLPQLNGAFKSMWLARFTRADDYAHDVLLDHVRHEVGELVKLTTPGSAR